MVTQVGPFLWVDASEGFHHRWIELFSTEVKNFFECVLVRTATAVDAIGSDGVECVDYGEDARADRDFLFFQSEWIATSIPLFMMLADYECRGFRKLHVPYHLLTYRRMESHLLPFFFR